ncbi:MAG: thymidylate kinase, partial [Proteobacteria bacterium]
MRKRFYGKGIPRVSAANLKGTLIVIEGSDGSGRSTQSMLLRDWLGAEGYPTTEVGLKRSELVGPELEEAMKGNTLHPLT